MSNLTSPHLIPPTRNNVYSAARMSVEFYNSSSNISTRIDGTCFLIRDKATEATVVVTNRHVVDPGHSRSNLPAGMRRGVVDLRGAVPPSNGGADEPSTWHRMLPEVDFIFPDNPEIDLAVWPWDSEVGGWGLCEDQDGAPHSPAVLGIWADVVATSQQLSELRIGERMYTTGFPAIAGAVSDLPLLFDGIVSSDPLTITRAGGESYPFELLAHSLELARHVRFASVLKDY